MSASAFLLRSATKCADPGAAVVTVVAGTKSAAEQPVKHSYVRADILQKNPAEVQLLESTLVRKAIEFVRRYLQSAGGQPAKFVMVTTTGLSVVSPDTQPSDLLPKSQKIAAVKKPSSETAAFSSRA